MIKEKRVHRRVPIEMRNLIGERNTNELKETTGAEHRHEQQYLRKIALDNFFESVLFARFKVTGFLRCFEKF